MTATDPAPSIRPRAAWYLVAAAVALAGVAFGTWRMVLAVRLVDHVESFQRIDAPGVGTVVVGEPGGYTVYLEGAGPFPGTSVELRPEHGGPPLVLEPYVPQQSYDTGRRQGYGAWSVQVPAGGRYELRVETAADDSELVVAFGRGLGRGFVRGVATALAILAVGPAAGAGIAVVTAVGRSRARRAQRPHPLPPPSWPPSPSAPGGSSL